MKYRIEGPAYEGAPEVWDIVNNGTNLRVCRVFSNPALANKIVEMLEKE